MAAKKEHYVNNKDFLEAMTAYKKEVDKAKRQKKMPNEKKAKSKSRSRLVHLS